MGYELFLFILRTRGEEIDVNLCHQRITNGTVLLFFNTTVDSHGIYVSSVNDIASELLRKAYYPIYVDVGQSGWQRRVFDCLQEGRVRLIISFSGGGNQLLGKVDSGPVNLYEHFQVPVVNLFGDYPFCPWVWDKLCFSFENQFNFHSDYSTKGLLKDEFGAEKKHFDVSVPFYRSGNVHSLRERRMERRGDIPFLYLGGYQDPAMVRAEAKKQLLGPWYKFFCDFVDEASFEYRIPIWKLGKEMAAKVGLPSELKVTDFRNTLYLSNQYVRFFRRKLLLENLVKYPGYFVLPSEFSRTLQFHKDAVVSGPRPFTQMMDLFLESRSVVMCLPNFACGHSERMINAMYRGCLVISSVNSIVESCFKDGDDFIALDERFGNLEEAMYRSEDTARVARITESAMKKVDERHDINDIVDNVLNLVRGNGFQV